MFPETESLIPEHFDDSSDGFRALLRVIVMIAPGGIVPLGIVISPTTPFMKLRFRNNRQNLFIDTHRINEQWKHKSRPGSRRIEVDSIRNYLFI